MTGSDGSYVAKVEALEAGGTVTVSASADGMSFAPASHEVSAVKDSQISGIDFTAFDHATITGRVLDADGGPVERVKVTATLVGESSAADSYTTRRTGTFRLSVPFGTYDIAGASDGYDYEYPNGVQRVTVAPGQAYGIWRHRGDDIGQRPSAEIHQQRQLQRRRRQADDRHRRGGGRRR